jgi:hypothetical protein
VICCGVPSIPIPELRPSLRLVLCRVWQGTFVLEHLAEIGAIDPAAAGRAADEVLGLVFRQSAHEGARRWLQR